VDKSLDEIIKIAESLRHGVSSVKTAFTEEIVRRSSQLEKSNTDLEEIKKTLDTAHFAHREDKERLEAEFNRKSEEQSRNLADLDKKVSLEAEARVAAENARDGARGDAAAEKQRLASLLGDLEEDASGYARLRPSRPLLTDDDTKTLREMFLTSSVAGSAKFSFSDLKQVLTKYAAALPDGPLKKLFAMVENDSKGRMSYITLVAVANDLAALVGDFRVIDTNKNDTLSRAEFRAHFSKLGFTKKSAIDSLFRYADVDESDQVSFSEYVHLGLCLIVLRILYTFADVDKSGQLSKEEVKKVLEDAHIPENARKKFDHQYNVVDDDDSKSLSYQEFVMLVLLMFHDE